MDKWVIRVRNSRRGVIWTVVGDWVADVFFCRCFFQTEMRVPYRYLLKILDQNFGEIKQTMLQQLCFTNIDFVFVSFHLTFFILFCCWATLLCLQSGPGMPKKKVVVVVKTGSIFNEIAKSTLVQKLKMKLFQILFICIFY